MRVINLSENNSVLHNFLSEMRDVNIQKDKMRFRRNVERIGEVMAFEVSRALSYQPKQIATPLGIANIPIIADQLVLATVLRAGLPLHQGFLNVFDKAECAFLSAYRRMIKDANGREQLDIVSEYMAAPSLMGKTLIIVDPMLASGMSLEAAYRALLKNGAPTNIHLCAVIVAPEGIEYLQQHMPDNCTLWCAAIDERLNDMKYIVPGLGDAGDLCFGAKL